MITSEEQATSLREAIELARARPATAESILRLRALASMQGTMIEGAIAVAFESRASGHRNEARGFLRELHDNYSLALRQAVAEDVGAKQMGKVKRWERIKGAGRRAWRWVRLLVGR